MSQQPRLDYRKLAAKSFKQLIELHTAVGESSVGRTLIDLIYLRVSQINGCAYCVDMHGRDLLSQDQSFKRINSLITWRESPFYTDAERAALAWAEAVTRLDGERGSDAEFAALQAHFSDEQIVDLTFVVSLMNMMNRIAIPLRQVVPQ